MGSIKVTLNPSDKVGSPNLSNGDLTFISTTSSDGIRANKGKSTGKWYWEVKHISGNANYHFGVSLSSQPISVAVSSNYRGYYAYSGAKYPELTGYGTSLTANDIISVLLDLDNGILEFWKNGVSLGVSHTDIKTFMGDNQVIPYIKASTIGQTVTFNFGATSFAHPIPNGYQPYAFEVFNKFLISSEDTTYSLYKKVGKPLIPLMDGYDNAAGSVIGSASYSTGYTWKVFDNDDTTVYTTNFIPVSSKPVYIGYRFNDPVCVKRYSFLAGLRTFKFMASNNGTTWDTLDTQTALVSNTTTYQTFDIKNEKIYNYYKIEATLATSGNEWISIPFVQFYGLMPSILLEFPSSEGSYIRNGMDKGFQIDTVEVLNVKQHINEDSIPLGSGKLFRQPIDREKHRAKKIILG
ncbi:SPRY domain-containing protein [Paenibacillus sp. W2I17]|uniref:SPRY domain-containing protein n=1 Tax=Paenibacillus sp. W2I17 TaxID=3042311 RepID=UPI00278704EA|nr:SPRY domain-containing protein [Paenibacillus sp. W2I17]MDQ0657515.1 hypothetical protein [Paenibacillus sp. W2I17]